VLRNYFDIPVCGRSRLDRLSNFGVYLRIYMPLSFSPIAALFRSGSPGSGMTVSASRWRGRITCARWGWPGCAASTGTEHPGVLAGALIASLPTILIFLRLQVPLRGLVLATQGE
jgi:ABC-type glycerol-3-phosphate transport system permease component